METTKEYLDEKFDAINRQFVAVGAEIGKSEARLEAKMATKEDLKGFATKEDLKSFATTDEVKTIVDNAVKDMHQFVIDGFTSHQTWIKEEFKEWIKPYDLRSRVEKVETEVAELKLHKKALA